MGLYDDGKTAYVRSTHRVYQRCRVLAVAEHRHRGGGAPTTLWMRNAATGICRRADGNGRYGIGRVTSSEKRDAPMVSFSAERQPL